MEISCWNIKEAGNKWKKLKEHIRTSLSYKFLLQHKSNTDRVCQDVRFVGATIARLAFHRFRDITAGASFKRPTACPPVTKGSAVHRRQFPVRVLQYSFTSIQYRHEQMSSNTLRLCFAAPTTELQWYYWRCLRAFSGKSLQGGPKKRTPDLFLQWLQQMNTDFNHFSLL